jgi:hypothetical protein
MTTEKEKTPAELRAEAEQKLRHADALEVWGRKRSAQERTRHWRGPPIEESEENNRAQRDAGKQRRQRE